MSMETELAKAYDAKAVEDRIYETWEKSGYFQPEAGRPRADNPNWNKPYVIALPPPNITGSLHMGHALNTVIQDILIRKKRMEGYAALWVPGTDHAGIATQNAVEKELKKRGVTRHDLGREKFLDQVWQWKEKYGNQILEQLKKIGASCDWSRTRFTMDNDYQKAVDEAFLHYYKKGWIYQGERVINWCPGCQTSLSDLELEYEEEATKLYYLKYPLEPSRLETEFPSGNSVSKFIVVATTRPETMLGDSAVAVNLKDERYKNLVGKAVILPLIGREIPIISDRRVEPAFGTGVVKVTPAHSIVDSEIGQEHHLEFFKVIDEYGKMLPLAGEACAGLTIAECRNKVLEDLQKQGLVEKTEDYEHNVARCYRCNSVVENLPSMQWFLKMDELAKKAIKAVESKKVVFRPGHWSKIYLNWLKNVRDWNISRQIWWGHKIPIEGVNDVLDTWFSSALWPFAVLAWPKKTKDLEEFYPTDVIVTDRGIINLWVARMVFSGLEFTRKAPFKDVIIHATVLTKEGKRMSKSLGTGLDPMNFIEQYGADATRFALIWQAMGGQDIHWSEEALVAGRKFLNKIWNASRFTLLQVGDKLKTPTAAQISGLKKKKILTNADKQIIRQLTEITKKTAKNIDKFEFGQALHGLYDFFWHDFCDCYIESSKGQMENAELRENTQKILLYVLATSLKLLHPFIPHITEEIWSKMPLGPAQGKPTMLIIEKWPTA